MFAGMELRDIEIFLTLAEELHFGRTAERMHVSQARVSQSIAKQERRIGAPLFERTSRKVVLTPIGEKLRDDLRAAHRLLREGIESAVAAAQGQAGTLTLGVMVNHRYEIDPFLDRFRRLHPQCDLRIREITFNGAFHAVRSGQVDVGLIWQPVREPDLSVGPEVYQEHQVLAVAAGHPLAARDRVSMEDLGGLSVVQPELDVPDYWFDAHTPRTTPSGRPIHRGPRIASLEEALHLISSGAVVSPVGAHAVGSHPRPGVAYVPMTDAPVLRYALVWRTATETALIRALAQAVD
jgi:DNA-binding transcriptional LysR family regulator